MKTGHTLLALIGAVLLAACSPAPARPTAAPPTEAPVAVPTDVATEAAAARQPEPTTAPTEAPQVAAVTKINLNAGTAEQFLTVPNVGNRMVREFQEYRPYASIQQFRREIGKYVDAAQVADYEKYVFVPIAPNEADEATLLQLPGVDAAIAGQLIAARPYATRDSFVVKLTELVGAEQAAAGQSMVAE